LTDFPAFHEVGYFLLRIVLKLAKPKLLRRSTPLNYTSLKIQSGAREIDFWDSSFDAFELFEEMNCVI
jgi:hypothetical protein